MDGCALPILDFKDDGLFEINKENFIGVLRKVGPRPFILYSINGPTRTGKSYALNYFIQYLEGLKAGNSDWFNPNVPNKFLYRGGAERTTLGINIWSEPYFVREGGREIGVLLMDTQGLFDKQTTSTQNAIIFSLSALCSSVTIFNLMRNVDENVLQQLEFFSGYAHLISTRSDGNGVVQKRALRNQAFQNLVFLIRDFDFPDYQFGYHDMNSTTPASPKNMCRDIFVVTENSGCPQENIFVRESILRSYGNIGIFLMPSPGYNFTRRDLNPDSWFNDNMKLFISIMTSPFQLVTKKIGGLEVTGDEFVQFIVAWAELCKRAEDVFPKVQTVMEASATIQCTLASKTAHSLYDKEIQAFFDMNPGGVDDAEFHVVHQTLRQVALETFNQIYKFGSDELQDEFRTALLEKLDKRFDTNRKFNQLLISKAATEQEVRRQEQNLQNLRKEMTAAEGKSQEEQAKLQMQIQQAEQKLQTVAKENVAVQNQLRAEIAETQANQARMVEENHQAQLNHMAQVHETDLKIAQYEGRLKEMQAQHEAEIQKQRLLQMQWRFDDSSDDDVCTIM